MRFSLQGTGANIDRDDPLQQTLVIKSQPRPSERWGKETYFLMLMIITPLVCLELVDPAVPFLAELTVKRLAGFAGGLCLRRPSESEMLRKAKRSGMISIVDR